MLKKETIKSETLQEITKVVAWVENRKLDSFLVTISMLTSYIYLEKPISQKLFSPDTIATTIAFWTLVLSILFYLRKQRKEKEQLRQSAHFLIIKLTTMVETIFNLILETSNSVENLLDNVRDSKPITGLNFPFYFDNNFSESIENHLHQSALSDEVKKSVLTLLPKISDLNAKMIDIYKQSLEIDPQIFLKIDYEIRKSIAKQNSSEYLLDILPPPSFLQINAISDKFQKIWDISINIASDILLIFEKISEEPSLQEAIDERHLRLYNKGLKKIANRRIVIVEKSYKLFTTFDKKIYKTKIDLLINSSKTNVGAA